MVNSQQATLTLDEAAGAEQQVAAVGGHAAGDLQTRQLAHVRAGEAVHRVGRDLGKGGE